MNTHEHRAKEVLNGFGAPVAASVAITNLDQAEAAIAALPGPVWVVKSQIHAGGRGKGGVRVSLSADEALVNVREMFGKTLITKQAGPRANRTTGSTSRPVQISTVSFTCRSSSTANPARPRLSLRPKAARTSILSPTTRRKISIPSGKRHPKA